MPKRKRTLKKPSKEGQISTHRIEKAVRSVHVVPSGGKWIVRKGGRGRDKVSKFFSSKREAVDFGKKVSQSSRTGMYIHHKNGRVKEMDGYGAWRSKG